MTIVVGVGQPLVGDDGVGPAVAARLRALGVPATDAADGAGLLTLLGGARRAIVVDAAVGLAAPGTVRALVPDELPPASPSVSSHGLSVPAALALAHALDPNLLILVVAVAIAPPANGPGLSPAAAGAVDEAATLVRALLA